MPALVAGIHVFIAGTNGVDGRSNPAMTKEIPPLLRLRPALSCPLALTNSIGFNGRKGASTMSPRRPFRRPILLTAALAVFAVLATSPARAGRCEDTANQLKEQIDGLKIGITAANIIYLSHPLAKEMSLGCANRKYSSELYVKAGSRKPKADFVALAASAAAIIFTLPRDDMFKGVSRCLSQMGFFRGDDINTSYRRLNMNCTRTKTEASIAITRAPDQ